MVRLPAKSGSILEAVLYRGELPRGEAGTVVGTGERQARRIVSALLKEGVLCPIARARRCVFGSPLLQRDKIQWHEKWLTTQRSARSGRVMSSMRSSPTISPCSTRIFLEGHT